MITAHLTARATTRAELCAKTGLPDRIVRRQIEQARRDGALIVNLGQGYYITTDLDALEAQYKIDRARALSVLARLKNMRLMLKAAGRLGGNK